MRLLWSQAIRSFTYAGSRAGHDLEDLLEVKLINTTSFEAPQFNGTFKYRKPVTEVFIRISGKDKLYRACDQRDFISSLLAFCDQLQ